MAGVESVLNAVLAPFPVTLVCLYDAARLTSLYSMVRATRTRWSRTTLASGPTTGTSDRRSCGAA
ncbi:MAG: hypothetical protein ACRDJ4_00535 [Actinomycetota bacterium]